ncbi:MAG TPA: patatin-like phospholipase family protein [Thermoanaerobaculia bacterium]|nr:patatin-like phospholipase family protein [Thermoanaerobaculia bacterium]
MTTASLHLCEVLEEEFEALHGELTYERTWLVAPAEIKDAPKLRARLAELLPERFRDVPEDAETLTLALNALLTELSGQKRTLLQWPQLRAAVGPRAAILERGFEQLEDQGRLHINRVFLDRVCDGLLENVHEVRLRKVYDALHEEEVSALCLSGGGIRSATFGLGVLQGLARHRVLDKFHYLSTVSGGGYIGAWFSSWIRRHQEGVRGVADDLHPGPRSKEQAEEKPVQHLREYSNYLTPRLGLLSADTWTVVAIYLRNLLLNWLVLFPLLVMLIVLPWLLNAIILIEPLPMLWKAEWVCLAAFLVSLGYLGFHRPLTRERLRGGPRETTRFLAFFLFPLIVSAGSALAGWAWYTRDRGEMTTASFFESGPMRAFMLAVVAVPLVSWAIHWTCFLMTDPHERTDPRDRAARTIIKRALAELFAAVASGSIMAALMAGFALTVFRHPTAAIPYHSELYVCFGVPLMLLALFVQGAIFIGGSSRVNEDYDREWWSRAGAWVLIAAVVWIVVTGVSIFGPVLIFKSPSLLSSIGGASGLIALLAGKSAKTPATRKDKEQAGPVARLTNIALGLTAPVFALFLLALLSLGLTWTVNATLPLLHDKVRGAAFTAWFLMENALRQAFDPSVASVMSQVLPVGGGSAVPWSVSGLDSAPAAHLAVIHGLRPMVVVTILLIMLAIEFLVPLLIDVNKFSMHSMYRNRLIRAYLGASRYRRAPNPFTGFDPQDNLLMDSLRPELFFSNTAFRNVKTFVDDLRAPQRCAAGVRRDVAEFLVAHLSAQTKKLLRRDGAADDIVLPLFLDLNRIMAEYDLGHLDAEPVPVPRKTLERVKAFTQEVLGMDQVARRDPTRVRRNRRVLEKAFADCIYPFDMPRVNRCDVADAAAIVRAIDTPGHALSDKPSLSRDEILHRIADELTAAERTTLGDANGHAPHVRDRVADCIVAALNRVIETVDLNDRTRTGQLDQQAIRKNRLRVDAIFDGALCPITLPRPLHVVNAALNLVGGENLAWQERKAEPFTITPLHCGSRLIGYRDTREYGGADGVSLGTAVTISGAAASPNMGYHSSPAMAFIMTLFNVRLGWWLGNPGPAGQKSYRDPSPRHSLWPMFAEAAGATNDRADYVYLSDGGHFENLGLYEMVLRRCHWIVLSDAGCDPNYAFDDLGNAIRKIRTDLGIEIEIRRMFIYPRAEEKMGKYCAVGRIRYDTVDPGKPDGVLIYLKPAVYGGEPKDVFNYSKQSAAFPHETTADQFFSESQFESYRMLGSHAIDQILGTVDAPAARLEEMANRAVQYADMTTSVQTETRDVLRRFLAIP